MLAEPTLWARITITPTQSFPVGLEKVQALLARSGAAPLDICFTRDCSRFEMQACWQHFHRLRSLELAQAIPPFALDCPMPMLETFRVSAATLNVRHAQIPASWAGDGTPRLSRLNLPNFQLPNSNQPLRNVSHFSGSMAGDVDASRLFALLPRLRSLQLSNITQSSRTPQGLVPESLREVSFVSGPTVLSDFSEHIEPYGSRLLQRLAIGETKDFAPILRIFISPHNSTWQMVVCVASVQMFTPRSADERNCLYVVKLDRDSARFAWDSVSNADVTRLTHLDVSLAMLAPLLNAHLTMPHLHRLVIGMTDMSDIQVLQGRRPRLGHTAHLTAPLLRTVKVVAREWAYETDTMHWFETKLPPLLETYIEHEGVLEQLSYAGPVMQYRGRMESPILDRLRSLARELVINGVSISVNAADDDGSASTAVLAPLGL
ncbi:hypothetical protein EXIGLDRAFT_750629 [Exidia glandulosa HHB12029]|uniref:F-box domain-containing protein n=1 Tax=Exidia glandulosa HHB12029 TaxID=1314781 RepID=A0A165GFT9_EXIGL|nr:hypothetical protein EXIGLDRAFT_750629 [Exidia glandulosa HHB12029]